MTARDRIRALPRRTLRRSPLLVREPGQRCDFCSRLTTKTAVAAGHPETGVVICSSCLEQAAAQLLNPGGGDAA